MLAYEILSLHREKQRDRRAAGSNARRGRRVADPSGSSFVSSEALTPGHGLTCDYCRGLLPGCQAAWLPRRLDFEGAVQYPFGRWTATREGFGSARSGGGPATRAEGDMRHEHAAYSWRDSLDTASKSRAAGRLRPILDSGPRVVFGTAMPDITPSGGRLARAGVISGKLSPSLLAEPRRRQRANFLIATSMFCGLRA